MTLLNFHPKRFVRRAKECIRSFFFYYLLPDRVYLKYNYKRKTGCVLNLKHPKTLNEKFQWMKLYYRNPVMHLLVNKYKVKEYIRHNIGQQYVVPTLATYQNVEQINWESLPSSFVLKCNHDSASIVVCKDKKELDIKKATKKLSNALKIDYYHYENKQWAYKGIPRLIMLEPLLQNSDGSDIVDYKFYCYGGNLVYFMYSLGETSFTHRNIKYNINKEVIDFYFKPQCQIDPASINLPKNIDKMIEIAESEGKKFPFLRLDMYNVDGRIYIGEYAFYSNGGFVNICNEEYSQYLSDLIDIKKYA